MPRASMNPVHLLCYGGAHSRKSGREMWKFVEGTQFSQSRQGMDARSPIAVYLKPESSAQRNTCRCSQSVLTAVYLDYEAPSSTFSDFINSQRGDSSDYRHGFRHRADRKCDQYKIILGEIDHEQVAKQSNSDPGSGHIHYVGERDVHSSLLCRLDSSGC